MKKYFVALVAVLVTVAVAMPVFALDVTLGGQFRARTIFDNNFGDVTRDSDDDALDDHSNFIDQRLRLYMTVAASQNLKLVTKFEMGDTVWGNGAQGGGIGADQTNIEAKNIYLDFAIPCTPVRAMVGIQGIALLNSWIVDEDFSAAVVKADLKPVTLSVGYIAGQHFTDGANGTSGFYSDERSNIDSFFLSADYVQGPLLANFVAYYQMAHDTAASADPATIDNSPFRSPTNATALFRNAFIEDNNLIDLGINLGYKVDWMSAYLTGVKNLGSVDLVNGDSVDYKGWMVDAGANFFMGPWTFNVGGFYTSGQDFNEDGNDIDFFTYPLQTSKYFSEIVGGGILDNGTAVVRNRDDDAQFSGYPAPSNLWTLTAGAAYQLPCKTKLSLSYWYFSTSEDVESGENEATDTFLGHEVDFYVTQPIVDGLNLDLVAAYLFAGDALSERNDDEDIYELGARLQWNF